MAARFVDDYLLYLLARASHAASAGFHARLKARGVPVPVWRVVATLQGAERGETVGALAAACLMQQPTMTKLLDRMEAEGLVRRRREGRQTRIALTRAGAKLAADLVPEARAHEATLLARHAEAAPALKALLRTLATPSG
ncbi:MarR family winged helix-turn-helix transcriptional regulator [Falsiroseomonas oryziterrae]|uniref:MarR family winged helix-turn-helix transcriptional regulator n=1 Tax=Falsiroseomonas oryziterrae TaxID=2911368 RepID=UPI001F3BE6E7|nr:MarR family winged helix-turn-helix transcriptional regulator [Roseomonas sp. NPKOSM-4]